MLKTSKKNLVNFALNHGAKRLNRANGAELENVRRTCEIVAYSLGTYGRNGLLLKRSGKDEWFYTDAHCSANYSLL